MSQENSSPTTLKHFSELVILNCTTAKLQDEAAVATFKEELWRLFKAGCRRMLINFSSTPFMTSSLLTHLQHLQEKMREADGKLVQCGVSDDIMEVYKITRLHKVFNLRKDVETALRTFDPTFTVEEEGIVALITPQDQELAGISPSAFAAIERQLHNLFAVRLNTPIVMNFRKVTYIGKTMADYLSTQFANATAQERKLCLCGLSRPVRKLLDDPEGRIPIYETLIDALRAFDTVPTCPAVTAQN